MIGDFGRTRQGQRRDGIDIAAREGAPVLAAEDGVVAYAGDGVHGYGRLILVRHGDGYITTYAHNAALLVEAGELVERGQVIARVGSTGDVTRSLLHFELRKGRKPIDPEAVLVHEGTTVASTNSRRVVPPLDGTGRSPELLTARLAAEQVLDELPGDPAGAGAPGLGPFQGLAPQPGGFDPDLEMMDVALDHGQIVVLGAGWKPSQRPKRSDSETFSSTASPGWIALERSFWIMSRASCGGGSRSRRTGHCPAGPRSRPRAPP